MNSDDSDDKKSIASTDSGFFKMLTNSFEELLRIIRDYGMPTVAFGAGIYGFLMILNVDVAVELKIGLAAILSLAGMFSQMWSFSRENPRIHSDEYTRLVESMITQNQKYVDEMSGINEKMFDVIEHLQPTTNDKTKA